MLKVEGKQIYIHLFSAYFGARETSNDDVVSIVSNENYKKYGGCSTDSPQECVELAV